jgi:hypothetical protein
MQGPFFKHFSGAPLSARASIALWLVLAGMVWGTVGFAFTYATQRGDDTLRAQADQLAKIVPAAGGDETEPDRNSR